MLLPVVALDISPNDVSFESAKNLISVPTVDLALANVMVVSFGEIAIPDFLFAGLVTMLVFLFLVND